MIILIFLALDDDQDPRNGSRSRFHGANRVFCRMFGSGGAGRPVSVEIVEGAAAEATSPASWSAPVLTGQRSTPQASDSEVEARRTTVAAVIIARMSRLPLYFREISAARGAELRK